MMAAALAHDFALAVDDDEEPRLNYKARAPTDWTEMARRAKK
jgi:hypothetical protein